MFRDLIEEIRALNGGGPHIPLHEPRFWGRERQYLLECVDSTYVSSVGAYVERLEEQLAAYTGAARAVLTVNGTAALHVALLLVGVQPGEEVLTQSLTFVATGNAITYTGARPYFLDIHRDRLSLDPRALERFLFTQTERGPGGALYNRETGRRIAACLPMHTFGFPCDLQSLGELCALYELPLVEDAAEALGSWYRGKHTGRAGSVGIFSFNGNKILTTGGGGALITDDEALADRAKHLTTTAKQPHPYNAFHTETGYNYRMPNLNAALGLAQLEQLPHFLDSKRALAQDYRALFSRVEAATHLWEAADSTANFWLNTLCFNSRAHRDRFLEESTREGVMARSVWTPLHTLPMFQELPHGPLPTTLELAPLLVNLPSSVRASKEVVS